MTCHKKNCKKCHCNYDELKKYFPESGIRHHKNCPKRA